MHRLFLRSHPASCRVAAKAGFATPARRHAHPDGWHDMHLHGRVRGDAQGAPAQAGASAPLARGGWRGGVVAGARVQTVRSIVNPDKLRHLGPVGDLSALLGAG